MIQAKERGQLHDQQAYGARVKSAVAEIVRKQIVGRENVIAGADCGFGTFAGSTEIHASVVWAKFRSLAEGARLATRELWGRA